ncbi:MAG: hypothetical protein P9M12_06000 [Candidatus Aceula lacicola]|nr:hypothetical protein [Candidatus Aceula lacicola]
MYRAITGLDLEVVVPREYKRIIDMYGRIINTPDNEVPGQAAVHCIRIAIIMGFVAIAAFFFVCYFKMDQKEVDI